MNELINFETFISTNEIFLKIAHYFFPSQKKISIWKKYNFWNFQHFFENNRISVKVAKVLGYILWNVA
jgi:hypothetical protein